MCKAYLKSENSTNKGGNLSNSGLDSVLGRLKKFINVTSSEISNIQGVKSISDISLEVSLSASLELLESASKVDFKLKKGVVNNISGSFTSQSSVGEGGGLIQNVANSV